MTDIELIAEYLKGSQEAFATLARRHMDWVHSAARRRLGDAHLAEDVTQDGRSDIYHELSDCNSPEQQPTTEEQ